MPDIETPVPGKIGFLGLGDQGGPMARAIARAGRDVIVFDTRPEALDGFESLGAQVAGDAHEVAKTAEIVAFCVRDESQATDLVLSENGLLTVMRPGQVLVMHSTVSPRLAQQMAAEAKGRGVGFLDAPVSGGSMKAREEGKLAVFVGGEPPDFDKAQPLLTAIGETVLLLGPVGSGEVGKLCNNLMLFCNTFASLEAARLAEAYGIPAATMVKMTLNGSAKSWSLEEWGFWHRMIPNHPAGDSRDAIIHFLKKDLDMAIAAARDVDVELIMGERAEEVATEVIGGIWDEAMGAK